MLQLSSRRASEERSVTLEQKGDRFLAALEITEGKGESITPRFNRTPLNGVSSLNCPPTGRGTNGANGFGEDLAEVRGYTLAACNLQLEATLLTIKYYNSPSKKLAGTTKNAHLSTMENLGTRDSKLFPFFLISMSEEQWSGLVKAFEMRFFHVKEQTPPNLPKGEEKSPFGGFRGSAYYVDLLAKAWLNSLIVFAIKERGLVANINKTSAYET